MAAVAAAPESATAPWTDFVHTGPGTLAGRYLRSFWQPVFVAKDLPLGKARPIRILGEDFTVYRGESGQPHVVGVRCAHRGTQLSIGWVEGETLRCRYHGWRYDADGQCVEQPGEPEPFCEKIRIPSYPTEEYLGLIFAYLGAGTAPPMPRFPDLQQPGTLDNWAQLHGCNFFTAIDNDPIHVYFVHNPDQAWRQWGNNPPVVWGEERDYGMEQFVRRPNGIVNSLARGMPNISYRPRMDHLEPADLGPTDHLQWRVPRDDLSHIVFTTNLIHLSEDEVRTRREARDPMETDGSWSPIDMAYQVLAGDLDLDEPPLGAGMRLTQLQDEATQIGQGQIPDHSLEHLGRSDGMVIAYRQLWMREMRNLAEGRPIKRWVAPYVNQKTNPGRSRA